MSVALYMACVTDEEKAGESAGLFLCPPQSHFLPEDTNQTSQID